MTPSKPEYDSVPVERDADAVWVDQKVAARLFGATPQKIGRYSILETLGSGGMGLVYRAHDPQLDRAIALKLLNADWSTPEGSRRMHREARAMARLSHPNVVQVYEVGQYRERVFLAMEYVEGETLGAWLERGPSQARILALFLAVGAGIAAAHGAGVVHRDLKPSNILVDTAGRPRVADFGLACTEIRVHDEQVTTLEERGDPRATITEVSPVVGTPRYMAPEQYEGRPATARSDQYGFCVMLWEALCGELPVHEPCPDALAGPRNWTLRPPPRRARLPRRVRGALARGLERDPSRRWSTMSDLLAALSHRSWLRRHRWIVVALALGAGLTGDLFARRAPTSEPCGPETAAIAAYVDGRIESWRAALSTLEMHTLARNYLTQMVDEWSVEARGLCSDGVPSEVSHARQTMRRGACVLATADLLDLWIADGKPVRAAPKLAAAAITDELERPSRWSIEPFTRACVLDDAEALDLWLGRGSARVEALARDLARARVLVDLRHAREALKLLAAVERHLDHDRLPAEVHLLRAKALRVLDGEPAEIRGALHAAEDTADRQRDHLGLFDALLEQVRGAVAERRRSTERRQSAPAGCDDRWDRALDRAAIALHHEAGSLVDDHVRLWMARADLAEACGRDDRAEVWRRQALDEAQRHSLTRFLPMLFSDLAARADAAAAAELDERALEVAADDDELRGYLRYTAALRAFARHDLERAESHILAAEAHYTRAFGPDAVPLAQLAYARAQGLYAAGESAAALPHVDAAIGFHRRRGHHLQLAASLYLRSALAIRGNDAAGAVDDARAALIALRAEPSFPDASLWTTVLQTGLVEAEVAAGQNMAALELAGEIERALDAAPGLGATDQRDELRLARARAWLHLGRRKAARRALASARDPAFLANDEFKRAEALALYAELYDGGGDEAAALFRGLGSDGAQRLRDARK
jgi:eukaryotic-like serine/threonine-protein kinase